MKKNYRKTGKEKSGKKYVFYTFVISKFISS
jgi:hypothetical protein